MENNTQQVSFRCPTELFYRMKAYSNTHDLTVSQVLRKLLVSAEDIRNQSPEPPKQQWSVVAR